MFLKNIGLFLAVAVTLIAYWLHEPIPDGIDEKNQLRITIALLKCMKALVSKRYLFIIKPNTHELHVEKL